jgi:hypothetical protein
MLLTNMKISCETKTMPATVHSEMLDLGHLHH